MYSIPVAMRRFHNLIHWVSHHYAVPGHFRRSSEELEAEGLLVLVQCCNDFPNDHMFFSRYFKRALYNRLQDLALRDTTDSRAGVQVSLEEAERREQNNDESINYFWQERAERVYPKLSRNARTFLKVLIDPPPEVSEYAWRQFCRRNKLMSQGQEVRGARTFRIRLNHIRQYLELSGGEMRKLIQEIKDVVHEGGS